MTEQITDTFLSTLNSMFEQKWAVVHDIDPNNSIDKTIALQIALRGKTTENHLDIVNDLFEKISQMQNGPEKDHLSETASKVMQIGSENLGIDWS